jgi:hypothetical protein
MDTFSQGRVRGFQWPNGTGFEGLSGKSESAFKKKGLRDCVTPGIMERVMGIEPTLSAWEAEVLPLNYTRR